MVGFFAHYSWVYDPSGWMIFCQIGLLLDVQVEGRPLKINAYDADEFD